MSYDIKLVDPVTKEVLRTDFRHHIRGGTYCIDGEDRLKLNVTYNYATILRSAFGDKGIRTIYGMSGAESLPVLMNARDALKDDVDDDYWKPTEGNVKRAVCGLIALAQMRPDGIWDGD
jgi:hypothetical protein